MTVLSSRFVENFDRLIKPLDCPAVTIGTSTEYNCTTTPNMRKTFYANGRFWAFYSDGTNMVYRSSADGVNWTDAVSVGACPYGHRGSVFFDGVYVHYARYDTPGTYYRRGKPESDGTITWSADEQVVYAGTVEPPDGYLVPMIAVDSEGFPWIGVSHRVVDTDQPKVVKSSKKDGTWETEFVYTLNETWDPYWWVTVVPLTDGKVYVIYCTGGPYTEYHFPLGRLYDGESWGSEESDLTDRKLYGGYTLSATNQHDDVHLAYLTETVSPYEIRYNKRTYGVGWQEEDELVAPAPTLFTTPCLSIDTLKNVIYCFWLKWTQGAGGGVRYKRRINGAWDVTVTAWIVEGADNPTDNEESLTSFHKDYNEKIGVMYATKVTTPMNVRFDYLSLPSPSPGKLCGIMHPPHVLFTRVFGSRFPPQGVRS